MASSDFVRLATMLHQERYDVVSILLEGKRVGKDFPLQATVTLRKGSNQTKIRSSKADFLEHVFHLQRIADVDGTIKFTRIRNLNQYWADIEHLTDEDHAKTRRSHEELASGKYVFQYDPIKLVDKFLTRRTTTRDKTFLPLKTDYYYILAYLLEYSRQVMLAQEKLLEKTPTARPFVDASDYLMRGFMHTGNPIQDYRIFKRYACFDSDALYKRTSTQFIVMEDTVRDFRKRGKVPGDVGVLKMVDIYRRCIELADPIINLLRAGMQLRSAVESPQQRCTLGENIRLLRSSADHGSLFSCLDEMIRHSDAHVSTEAKDGKLYLFDTRGRKAKMIRTYTFQEALDMASIVRQELLPALLTSLLLYEMGALDLVSISYEYRHSLLAIGNS